jgi:demethylmenaquinone methyltransferase/2-methoxy-6-polyprenyl-1,4-benzoquinol methylase
MLAAARTSVPLARADALRLPLRDGGAAGATCGFALRNVVSVPALFAELARVVRPGGRVALLETARPEARLLRLAHDAYMRRVVPAVGAILSDREAYAYLPRSLAYLPEPHELLRMLSDAGFWALDRRTFSAGAAQLLTATRR